MNWNWYNLEIEIDLLKGNMYITRRHNITFSSRVIENMKTKKKLHNVTEIIVVVAIIDDDYVGLCGYQQFWEGFLLIHVKGENIIL